MGLSAGMPYNTRWAEFDRRVSACAEKFGVAREIAYALVSAEIRQQDEDRELGNALADITEKGT